MTRIPAWKDDFPIAWVDDHYVTRREFTKSLVLVSCSAFAANGALLALGAAGGRHAPGPRPPLRIAAADAIPVGGAKVFDFPDPGDRCLLLRLGPEKYAAFGQKCTHLGCPVLFRPEAQCLYCPCHEGYFDAADGRVLSGPPPRPLPRITLEHRDDGLWATGIEV
jgi:nitrite reductase/ring-hydroxylating ferredoxin subunit